MNSEKSIKILIHSNTLWSIVNFRFDLINALINTGYKVICLAPKDDISNTSESRLRLLSVDIVSIQIDRKGTNVIKDSVYLLKLIRAFIRIKPDAVLNYTPKVNIYSSLACQLLKIPYINTINGLGSGFLSGFPVANIMQGLYKLALRKSKQVFVQNRDDLNYFLKSRISPAKVSSLIPGSGVNVSAFQYDGDRRPVPSSLIFLFAGRLIKEKGVFDFVYMAEQLKRKYPACRFWMVGFLDEGNPSSLSSRELDDLISSGVIEYKGKTDHIIEYLNSSDIMVFPSDREGLPRTLLEAASCSMPIVTYDVPGCREVVSHGENGYLCNAGNREQLKDVCEKLVNMQQSDLVMLGLSGRKTVVENFTVEIVNRRYLLILQKLF